MNFTKLTSSSRLFLVAIIGTSSFCNSFTIWNLRFIELYLKLFIVFQTPFQGTQVEFTLTMNQNLFQLFRLFYYPSRIFLTHAVQYSHHLFCISFIDRLNSTSIFRIRILNKVKTIFAVFTIQGISCLHIFQFHCTSDISRTKFVYLFTVSSGTHIKLCHAFFRTTIGIIQIITFVYNSTHNLEVLYISDMWFNCCFKEIQRSRSVCIRSNRNTTSIMNYRHI